MNPQASRPLLERGTAADDQIVGDGDCGETCAAGAKAVLEALKSGLGSDGDIVNLFRELTEIIDGESWNHDYIVPSHHTPRAS